MRAKCFPGSTTATKAKGRTSELMNLASRFRTMVRAANDTMRNELGRTPIMNTESIAPGTSGSIFTRRLTCFTRPRTIKAALLGLALVSAGLASVQAGGLVTVRPKETDDVLVNPGIGFTTFQRFNGDR